MSDIDDILDKEDCASTYCGAPVHEPAKYERARLELAALREEVGRLREALDDFHDAVCDACESCDPHPPTKPWATETQAIDACMRAAVAAGDALRYNAAKEEA